MISYWLLSIVINFCKKVIMDKLFFSVTSISTDFRYRFLSISYANISQLHFDTVGITKLLSNLDDIKSHAGYWKMQLCQ